MTAKRLATPKAPSRKRGRPSLNAAALKDAICARLTGGESLRAICRDETMPGAATVFEWLEADPEFRSKYARAREVQAELMADELLEIADDGQNDWMERHHGDDVGYQENGEALRRSQMRIATRQWIASKLLPKKYGDKLDMNVDGTLNVTVQNLTDGTPGVWEQKGIKKGGSHG